MKLNTLLILFLLILNSSWCYSDLENPKMSITGSAEIYVPADTASFRAEVSTDGTNAYETLAKHSNRINAVVEAFKKMDIKDKELKTSRVSLTPSWSPRPRNPEPNWRPVVTGYTANGGITVKTSRINETGKMLATAVDAGANSLSSISFSIANPRPHRLKAIEKATKNAKEEAVILAKAANVNLGKIASITLQSHGIQQPRTYGYAKMEMYAAADSNGSPPTVLGGLITVRSSVSISWEIDYPNKILEEGNTKK